MTRFVFALFVLASLAAPASAQVKVERVGRGTSETVATILLDGRPYMGVNEVARLVSGTKYWRSDLRKLEIRNVRHSLRVTVDTPYAIVDDVTIRLPAPVRLIGGEVQVPLEIFPLALSGRFLPRAAYDARAERLVLFDQEPNLGPPTVSVTGPRTRLTLPLATPLEPSVVSSRKSRFMVDVGGGVLSAVPGDSLPSQGLMDRVRLGATRSMEEYLRYLFNLAASADGDLGPVYGIHFERELHEREADDLAGYRGMGPVRVGNDAWRQRQNDVYGSIVLAAVQLFFDQRLDTPGDSAAFARLEHAGEAAWRVHDSPDAGLWEFRGRADVHTYSAVMSWAACDRLARIARHLGLEPRASLWAGRAHKVRELILARAVHPEHGHFVDALDGDRLDASLLLLADLGFVGPPTIRATSRPWTRSGARCGAATTCCATSSRTISACRRRASRSAASGTSTPSPRPAAPRKRAPCSNSCWRDATRSG